MYITLERGSGHLILILFLHQAMVEHAYSCATLHSGRSMRERSAALEAFKNGEVRFLICTDVAARGIDIKELPFVISMSALLRLLLFSDNLLSN